MIYKVPCPTNTNGIKLLKVGEQIHVEYQTGEPNVRMAYDSASGKAAHTVTFKPKCKVYGRDDLPSGTGIEWSKGKMAQRGSANINDEDPDEDGGDEVVTKLMSYLNDKLTPEQLASVAAILGSADDDDNAQAADRVLAARRVAMDAEFNRMFPTAKLIKLR